MIIPMLVASSLVVVPVKETVWWNTPGGTVTEHQDESGASCSLMLYNDDGSVVFQWADTGRTLVTAIDWNWQFPDDSTLPVAMQLGDVWLSNGGDSAIIQGVGHGNTVSFPAKQRVDDILRPADHVAVRTTSSEFSITLNRSKVGVLLSRARLCRDAIGKTAR